MHFFIYQINIATTLELKNNPTNHHISKVLKFIVNIMKKKNVLNYCKMLSLKVNQLYSKMHILPYF